MNNIKWISREEAEDLWPTPKVYYHQDYIYFGRVASKFKLSSTDHSYKRKKVNPKKAKQKAAKLARKRNRRK